VGKTTWTIIALAAIAVGAIFFAKGFLAPAQEEAERNKEILNKEARPRVLECVVLEDGDLPDGITAPQVGEDVIYVLVTVFYPDFLKVPDLDKHVLDGVNGSATPQLRPVDATEESDERGAYAALVFKTNGEFAYARLIRADEVLEERVTLE
jgi:hypothetical protein